MANARKVWFDSGKIAKIAERIAETIICKQLNTATSLALIDDIIANLSRKTLRILMSERYIVKVPTSFGIGEEIWSDPLALIWKNVKGYYEVGVATYHCKPAFDEDQKALDAFEEFLAAMNQSGEKVVVQKGQFLIFNNNRLLHARDYIQGKRLLLRTYIKEDLMALRAASGTSGNIFDVHKLLQ